MNIRTTLFLLILLTFNISLAQNSKTDTIPPDGEYTYDIAFAEWGGKSMGEKVTVIVKDGAIKIIYDGGGEMISVKKGSVLDEGKILKHTSGAWIISTKENDINAEEVGGCSDGPNVIDFDKKKFWMC